MVTLSRGSSRTRFARCWQSWLLKPSGRTRANLAALLWPDYPTALAILRNVLANLRHAISDSYANPPFLLISRETLQLNLESSISIDLLEFQKQSGRTGSTQEQIAGLKAAAALFRGPFLEGFSCDSPVFEEWALSWRRRLEREQRDTLGKLSFAYAQNDEHELSIQSARRLLELEPWDEAAHRLVMQGLAKNGQSGAALAQYETCRKLLLQELRLEPSAETQALAKTIREGTFAPLIPAAPAQSASISAGSHLPVSLISFIGRQSEIKAVCALLGHPMPVSSTESGLDSASPVTGTSPPMPTPARLLTLCGAGGCGKTRLALETARGLIIENAYPHGVWWVNLSPIADPEMAIPTVAAAFGLIESSRTPLLQVLINYLCQRKLLLLLDNAEHLLDTIASLAQALLEESPGVQILATSREPLAVPGEVVWRVPSLAVPEVSQAGQLSLADLRRFDAVQLFEERARSAMPGWTLDGNARAVVEICNRLDGIPLAIELAAARARMLSVEQINERLGDLFHLLTGGSRTGLPRHQTLHACIDWSYHLLTPADRTLLRMLSVFNGGWTLEAAEFVGKGAVNEDVLDLLTRLVDRSLVLVTQQKAQGTRYHLLQTIRQYAREKLVEAGEEEAALRAHLDYFVDFACRAENELRGPDQVRWHAQAHAELPNLRVALEWSLKDNPAAGMRIAGALFWFWRRRIDLRREGFDWLERCLAADSTSVAIATDAAGNKKNEGDHAHALNRGLALNAAFSILRHLLKFNYWGASFPSKSQNQAAERKLDEYQLEGLELFRGLGKPGRRGLAFLLNILGRDHPDPQQRKALHDESLAIFREEGDTFRIAEGLHFSANLAIEDGNILQAKQILTVALSLYEEVGDLEGIAYAHSRLGWIAVWLNDFQLAQWYFSESLARYQSLGHVEWMQSSRQSLAITARLQGNLDLALRYSEETLAVSRESKEELAVINALVDLGETLLSTSPAQACAHFRQALLVYKKVRYESEICNVLELLAYGAANQGQPERAARLLGAAVTNFQNYPFEFMPFMHARREHYRAMMEFALGADAFARAWSDGEAMPLDHAVAYGLEET